MTEEPYFEILDQERLIPASELSQWLGRIVRRHSEPEASYTPTDPSPFITWPLSITEIDLPAAATESMEKKSIGVALAQSTSFSKSSSLDGSLTFSARKVVSVRLQRQDKIFRTLTESEEVKADLRAMLTPGGRPAFMIVGVLIWSDATFTSIRALNTSLSSTISSPLKAAFEFVTGSKLPAAILGAKVSPYARGESTSKVLQGISVGSHIFAIQYKTVRRPSFALGSSFSPRLDDRGPRVVGSKRFGDDDDDDEDASLGLEGGDSNKIDPLEVEMDEDFVDWVDVLDEDEEDGEMETDVLGTIGLAYLPRTLG